MAVTAVLKRVHVFKGTNGTQEIGTAALTGTLAAGGFNVDCRAITGGIGTSPYGGLPTRLQFDSPLGYIYAATFGTGANSNIANVVVYSAPNTPVVAGAPEASVPFTLTRRIVAG